MPDERVGVTAARETKMFNFNNIATTAKLFHSANIDEWMEASAEDAAVTRQSVINRHSARPIEACETKPAERAAKSRRKVRKKAAV